MKNIFKRLLNVKGMVVEDVSIDGSPMLRPTHPTTSPHPLTHENSRSLEFLQSNNRGAVHFGVFAFLQIFLSALQALQLVLFLCKLCLGSFLFGSKLVMGFRVQLNKLEFNQYHFAFLYESKIWLGANNIAAISNRIDRLIIPLNKNKTEGITDSASALNMLLFLKQIIQIAQYNTTNIVSTIRYMANASSDHHPNHVPGMLIIIKPKQPNLPICSATSINLLLHLFSKPSLHLIAKIILGIIMTAIIISPNIFNQSIYSSANSDVFTFKLTGGEQHFMLFADGKSTRDGCTSVTRKCSSFDGTK